ncbi:MAG: hypothetical protein [Caudoviricetes sp.]|nr:MAG: hypothetical protein [Caudoviricetes sp.]
MAENNLEVIDPKNEIVTVEQEEDANFPDLTDIKEANRIGKDNTYLFKKFYGAVYFFKDVYREENIRNAFWKDLEELRKLVDKGTKEEIKDGVKSLLQPIMSPLTGLVTSKVLSYFMKGNNK